MSFLHRVQFMITLHLDSTYSISAFKTSAKEIPMLSSRALDLTKEFKTIFEILVIVIDSMCGDPLSDILYLAIPTVLLGAGAFFMMGKDGRKKIEEIFRTN